MKSIGSPYICITRHSSPLKMSAPLLSVDNFDQIQTAAWRRDARAAFAHWQSHRLLGPMQRSSFVERSNRQYAAMFGRFCAWLEAHSLGISDFEAVDLAEFLCTIDGREGRAADSTIRRYLTLLEKVLDYINLIGVRGGDASGHEPSNPARDLLVLPEYRYREPPAPVFLTHAASERYIDWVRAQEVSSWVDVRDKALRMVFLSCGTTVDEVRRVRLDDARVFEESVTQLHIRSHLAGARARVVPLASWAWSPLTAWYRLRCALVAPTDALFLTRCTDFRLDEPGDDAVSATEIYTIIQEAMQAIGHMGRRQGPQTLRHTFTARQLLAGTPKDRIAEWLGLQSTEPLAAIERQLPLRGSLRPV